MINKDGSIGPKSNALAVYVSESSDTQGLYNVMRISKKNQPNIVENIEMVIQSDQVSLEIIMIPSASSKDPTGSTNTNWWKRSYTKPSPLPPSRP